MKYHLCRPAVAAGIFILFLAAQWSAPAQTVLPSISDPRFLTPIANPDSIPKFMNTLPVVKQLGLRVDAEAKTNFTVRCAPCEQDMLGTGQMTKLLGFSVDNLPVTHPGATIVAKQNVPVHVTWINDLGFTYPLPVDTSFMWAYSEPPYWGRTIANNGVPFVPHLHGGHTDAIYDGLPDQWWTPLYHSTSNPLAKGKSFMTNIYTYDNSQEAATLWYHDHSHGITRLQAYMGLAGFYFVRDNNELGLINSSQIPSGDYEIELAIQDKVFWPNGQLAIPDVPRSNVSTEIMQPEFFGNVICVNGKAWPKLAVERRQYRFRILNGSDSRFYHVWLDASGVTVPFKQIGSELGFLASPVTRDSMAIGCGERYDIVVDFSDPALAGKSIVLRNDAVTPFGNAMGDPTDANTGVIMRFDVGTASVADPVHLPASLRPAIAPLVQTGPTRQLILGEMTDAFGRTMPMLGTAAEGVKMYMDPTTEFIKLNDVETWQIYNTTMDAHPIHLHLVGYQIVSRQAFMANQDPMTGALSNIMLMGSPIPIPPEQQGWKDTDIMYPGEVTTIRAKFDKPGEYVWHCHILSHEEYDMMRPFYVRHPLVASVLSTPANLGTGIKRTPTFNWNAVLDAASYTIQIAPNPSFTAPVVAQSGIAATTFTPSSALNANTLYYWRVAAVNADGTGPWSDVYSFTTETGSGPSHFAFMGNTGSSKTVAIPNTAEVSLDGVPLVSGDEIGVFTAANLCVGAVVWHGTSTALTVWGDNPQTPDVDGMLAGDSLHFRVWKQSNGSEYLGAAPAYASGDGLFHDGAMAALSSLKAVTSLPAVQSFVIPPGWNIVSSYVRPSQASLDSISAPFIANLVLMKDGLGNVYWPSFGVRSLSNWNTGEGYQVYMQHGDTAVIAGVVERPEAKPLGLPAGWSMIGYIRSGSQTPNVSLNSIAAHLVLVKNNYGQIYWPLYGINTITSLEPGQGYQIYMSAPDTLRYPANDVLPSGGIETLQPSLKVAAPTNHFAAAHTKTGSSSTLLLRFREVVPDMDEAAVKNSSGVCVGTGVVAKQQAVITIWGDNAATKETDGALEGDVLTLSYWSASDRTERHLTIDRLTNGMNGKPSASPLGYQSDGITIADVVMGTAIPTAVAEAGSVPTDYELGQNYPNPFNPSTKIAYGLPEQARVSIDVYDMLGQRVGRLVDEVKSAGYHEASFDASHLASGIYIYRLTAGNVVRMKKMVLVR